MKKMNSFAAAGLWASALALPFGSTAAVAQTTVGCTSAQAGCVLPVQAAPAVAAVPAAERGSSFLFPALLAAAALIAGILLLADGDDDEAVSR